VSAFLHQWFQSPGWLWMLIPALALVIADSIRRWGTARAGRRVLGATIRLVALAGLVVALADPRWHERKDVAHVVFVVDRSASVPDASLERALDRVDDLRADLPDDAAVGLVLFDAEPEVAVAPGEPWSRPGNARPERVEATDIDGALQLAMGLIPADDGGEVVLISDGRSTSLDGRERAVAQAAERGVRIHGIVLEPARDDPAVSAVVLASAEVRPGSTIEGRVELDGAAEASRGTVVIKIGDDEVARQPVDLPAGERVEVPFSHEVDARTDPGTLDVTAEFIPTRTDADPDNNKAVATAVVGEPPLVRLFAGEKHDATNLARALRAERMDVQVVQMEDYGPQYEDLDDVDLVVLANAPAASIAGSQALQPAFLDKLAHFVDAGGGLIVLGGPMAFDMGGYGSSALDRVLPVKLDPVDPEVQAAATIIIVLDRSGSMSAIAGFSKTKMTLADEGAAASIDLLRPFDRVGVMSVTESVRWEIPTQPVVDPSALKRKVMRITPDGGGIFVYTGLEAANQAMSKVSTPLRHVILFSDAADSEEKYKGVPFGGIPSDTSNSAENLAARMRARGITTSVIGIGLEEDVDTPFLKDLARSGGGRFYLTADATKLRSLFVEETERLVDSSMKEVSFRPVVERVHPIVAGIDYATGPQLRGYQELEPRPTAEVVLSGPEGHPIMTTWRYGLGQVVAWSSDSGPRWAENWLGWSGYSKQWTQAARFALRSREGDETAVEVDFNGETARLRIARRDTKGMTIDAGAVRARVKVEGGETPIPVRALEPGLWEGDLETKPGQTYTVEVLGKEDDEVLATRTFVPPPSPERRHRTADQAFLALAAHETGGKLDPDRIEPETVSGITTDVHRLWPWFVLLALALLPVDALIRRPARVV
jgi:uncharacterized membrane protein